MSKVVRWRPFLAGGLMTLVVALAGAAGTLRPVPVAEALTNCTVSDISIDSEEAAFLTLINAYRAQNGRGALTLSTNLNRAATWHGTDMATKGYFSHTDSLGRSPSTRARDCDYPGGAGENIAAGTVWDTAQEAFDAWRNSSGHNANMLNASYVKIGIARVYVANSQYRWYWVTNFGTVND
ncbi:MAG TPA: CAP domain-containing protein, partial [Tepidiformaceae bacterium]|nr:CAP domain-containing protein [Tepidiformaceae bacterium]